MHTRQGFFLRIGVKNWRNFPLPSNTNKAGDAKEEHHGLSGRSKVNKGIESCGFMQMNMGCWTWSWVFFPSMYRCTSEFCWIKMVSNCLWFSDLSLLVSFTNLPLTRLSNRSFEATIPVWWTMNHGTMGPLGWDMPPTGPNCCWRFPGIAWFGPVRHKEGGPTWYQRAWPGWVYLRFQEVRT